MNPSQQQQLPPASGVISFSPAVGGQQLPLAPADVQGQAAQPWDENSRKFYGGALPSPGPGTNELSIQQQQNQMQQLMSSGALYGPKGAQRAPLVSPGAKYVSQQVQEPRERSRSKEKVQRKRKVSDTFISSSGNSRQKLS